MPPATFPSVFAAPETGEGSLPIKPLETGTISPELEDPIFVGNIFNASLCNRPLDVDVIALDIPGSSVDAETEGLINAAIENSEVA